MKEDYERKELPPEGDAARAQYLGKGVPTPDLVTVKDFLRFYIATSKSQIDDTNPIADSICTVGEWFFAAFTRVTGTETKAEDRSEVYYIRWKFSLSPCSTSTLRTCGLAFSVGAANLRSSKGSSSTSTDQSTILPCET